MKIKHMILGSIALIGLIIPAFSFAATEKDCKPYQAFENGACVDKENLCKQQPCRGRDENKKKCVTSGIKLNTNVPFIGSCIFSRQKDLTYGTGNTSASVTEVDQINAFPTLIGGLMSIVTTAMLITSFLMIVFAGVMMTMGGYEADWFNKGKGLIFKVAGVLALLGLSGVILKIINPTFFS